MKAFTLMVCFMLVLVSVLKVSENGEQLDEEMHKNPEHNELDLPVIRKVREETEEQRRKFKNKKKPNKNKNNTPKNKIKSRKRILRYRYRKLNHEMGSRQNTRKNDTLDINKKLKEVFDIIKLYSNYQNALRKGKRIAQWFKTLKTKAERAQTYFRNFSEALNHATNNGTKCGRGPLDQEAKDASSILRNCALTTAESCSRADITSIRNTADCSSCQASCTFTDCKTTTCVSNCPILTTKNTLDDQAVTDFETKCKEKLDKWTSRFKDCIFTKTFKTCSLSCLSDKDRRECNLNECKKQNCPDCADCDVCSLQQCIVNCNTSQSCATGCKYECLRSLGTLDKSCKDFGKNFLSVTQTRKQRCIKMSENKESGNFGDCKQWSLAVPYYTKKCCNCSVSTKAPTGRSQHMNLLKVLQLKRSHSTRN